MDAALGGGLGSAIAVSVGDARSERCRVVRGHLWRVPSLGPEVGVGAWFDLASLTKPMVTVAVAMVLVDQGRLELGAPVRRWLPDAATEGSVAQLLGHAAGCAAHVRFFEQLGAGGDDARAALLQLARRHPVAAAGGASVYSDLGYLQMGEVLERVGGARLDALFTELVAQPLGLRARFVDLTDPRARLEAVVATELVPEGLVIGVVHDENARAGGGVFGHAGLFGRVEDVAEFARGMLALEGPGGLVRSSTARAFFETAPGGGSWRLGWDTPSATRGTSHAGDLWPRRGVLGHLGFTGCSLWLELARGRWVAILSNRVHPSREGSAEGIKQLRRDVMDAAWRILEG
ncbi:MAG: serine hydrolase domain-containing protein [Kofleriaceae bacterium]